MKDGSVETLALALAAEAPDAMDNGRVLFLNARPQRDLAALGPRLTSVQEFRPDVLDLAAAGMSAVADLADIPAGTPPFDAVLVLAGKHRRLNEAYAAIACQKAKAGAPVIISGEKDLGIASLRKRIAGHTEILGSHAKHHATAFTFAASPDLFSAWHEIATMPAPGFSAEAGLFSADHPDPASLMLAVVIDAMPAARLAGRIADFGCGWGYLSARLLEKHRPASLTLIDASARALVHAHANVSPLCAATTQLETLWCDITREPQAGRFDTIIMNPPFHRGRKGEPDIGLAFIAAARRALVARGRLLLVANRHLPYASDLGAGFSQVNMLAEDTAYKVIEAIAR